MTLRSPFALLALTGLAAPALACSLCANVGTQNTFRQDATDSKLILYGTIEKPRLNGAGGGATDFVLDTAIKTDPALGDKKVVELPRFLPVNDPKDPPHYVLFCDVFKGKLDFFRGVPVKSAAAVDYIKGLLKIDPKDRTKLLLHCFQYLEHADKEIAFDAYLEFAKATDQEIGQVAGKLSAEKLRGWLTDPRTPAERLGMYAFLLGGCGGDVDAALLRELAAKPTERTTPALDGILGALIQLQPRAGWDQALGLLRDEKQPFPARFAVVRTLRVFHNWKPKESAAEVQRGLRAVLAQGDLADLAISDLTRWQSWDLTADVLALYGKKGYDAPIVRRAILRYALSCPKAEAATFIADRRKLEPDLVAEVEDGLRPTNR